MSRGAIENAMVFLDLATRVSARPKWTGPAREACFESGATLSFVNPLPFGKCRGYTFFMATAVDCQCRAFQLAIEVLGRPWTALLLTLLQAGPRRFNEIGEAAPGLGTKVLSVRLKDLEARGLIARHVEPGPPVRVTYELTQKGRAFGQVAQAVQRWGHELAASGDAPPRRRARSSKSRVAA
jgi:DNA-binding HxlR family transcriptional regulator